MSGICSFGPVSRPKRPRDVEAEERLAERGRALGARIAEARKMRGLTMNELDRRIGQGGYTTRLEAGKKLHCDFDVVAQIAEALNVNLDWLSFGIGPMERVRALPSGRYPNLARASEAARVLGIPRVEEAIAEVSTMVLRGDQTADDWLDDIRYASKRLRTGMLPPDVTDETVNLTTGGRFQKKSTPPTSSVPPPSKDGREGEDGQSG
jgi:transcriptional regulator with XRE-family HTH domain